MKRLAILIYLLFSSVLIHAQKIVELFNGYIPNIVQTGQGTVVEEGVTYNTFAFSGVFQNDLGQYDGSELDTLSAEKFLALTSDGHVYELKILTITSGAVITGTAVDYSGELSALPAGAAAIYVKTPNKKYPASTAGLSVELREAIDNYFKTLIDIEPKPALGDLTDVVLTNPVITNILQFDGTNWVNAIPPSSSPLNSINAINGLNDDDNLTDPTIKLGGELIENTSIYGNWNFGIKTTKIVPGDNHIHNQIIMNPGADTENLVLEAYNEFGTQSTRIRLNPISVNIETPNVTNSLALNGQVLKLIDNTAGTVEYGDETDPVWNAEKSTYLSGVLFSNLLQDQILQYNGTNWVNVNLPSGQGPIALNDLTDVTLNGSVNGQVLTYENGIWKNLNLPQSGISLSDLSVISNPAGTQSLTYNSSTGEFTYTPADLSSYLTAEVDGSVSNEGLLSASTLVAGVSAGLTSNTNGGSTVNFVAGANMAVGSSGGNTITYTNTAPDRTVTLTGTGNTTITGTYPDFTINSESTLNELTDVNVAGAVSGQVLKFDGTQWLAGPDNTGSVGGGVSSVTANNGLTQSGTAEDPIIKLGGAIVTPVNITDVGAANFTIDLDGVLTLASPLLTLGKLSGPSTTIILPSYANGTKQASTLNKTWTNYVAGFADDGTLLEIPSLNLGVSELNGLEDVLLSTPTTGQVLKFNGTDFVNAADEVNDADANPENEGKLTVLASTATSAAISSNTANSTDVTIAVGTGLSIDEAGNTITLTNSAPDQTVSLTSTDGSVLITGTYPSFNLQATVSGNFTDIDQITFNDNVNDPISNTLQYNPEYESFVFGSGANNTLVRIGQDLFWFVKNQTGSPIAKGVPVYVTGTDGNSGRKTVGPMIANGTINAKFFLGVTAEAIANGGDGLVSVFGSIRGVDLSGFSANDVLYVSPTVAGTFVNTEPIAPQLKLPVGYVVNNVANGTLSVRVTNGSYLSESHDVQIAGATTGEVLKYDGTRWVDGTDLVDDADADPNNEIQTITASNGLSATATGNNYNIKLGGTNISDPSTSIFLSGQSFRISDATLDVGFNIDNTNNIFKMYGLINLDDYGSGTKTGTLAYLLGENVNGNIIEVDPALYQNTDNQQLSLTNNLLSLTNGGSVNLAPYLDEQEVSITGSGATTVTGSHPNFIISSSKLTEAEVDAFVANNGYLTTEVDGSISNEGVLSVSPGLANTAIINSNTSGSPSITIEAASGISISEDGNKIILGNATTASNGLTKTGSNIELGGTLSEITNIDLAGFNASFYDATTETGIALQPSSNLIVNYGTQQLDDYGLGNKEASDYPTAKTVNYMAGIATDGTIVDVPVTTVGNGIVNESSVYKLGGTLTKNTFIDATGYNFEIQNGPYIALEADQAEIGSFSANGSLFSAVTGYAKMSGEYVRIDSRTSGVRFGFYGAGTRNATQLSVEESEYAAAFSKTTGTLIEIPNPTNKVVDKGAIATSTVTLDFLGAANRIYRYTGSLASFTFTFLNPQDNGIYTLHFVNCIGDVINWPTNVYDEAGNQLSTTTINSNGAMFTMYYQASIDRYYVSILANEASTTETESMIIACSDESTAITATGVKATFRAPQGITITGVKASLGTASTSGNLSIDITNGGTSIFSTPVTILANQTTSKASGTTQPVISAGSIADDAELKINLTGAGTGAAGLKVTILYTKN